MVLYLGVFCKLNLCSNRLRGLLALSPAPKTIAKLFVRVPSLLRVRASIDAVLRLFLWA